MGKTRKFYVMPRQIEAFETSRLKSAKTVNHKSDCKKASTTLYIESMKVKRSFEKSANVTNREISIIAKKFGKFLLKVLMTKFF